MTRRIGIYPGTFDPVHQGHLAFCQEVIKRGEVDEIILLPERLPRGKPGVTPLADRLDLLTEVTRQFPLVRVMSVASDRFTVRSTLPQLRERLNGALLSLLIGSDIVPSLQFWDNLDELLEDMPLIIGMRQADTSERVEAILTQIGQAKNIVIRYSLIETAHAAVASSHIRSGKMIVDFKGV